MVTKIEKRKRPVDRSNINEIETFRRLMKLFPTGFLSIVSDTWDLWKVCTEYLPALRSEIMARDGKIVIRPDSGDPVDIICGRKVTTEDEVESLFNDDDILYRVESDYVIIKDQKYYEFHLVLWPDGSFRYIQLGKEVSVEVVKGVVQLLFETFGGQTNELGFITLDSHIGAIYGDSITLDRAKRICERLMAKGFASTNVVFGIGSYTYQYNTRDTFGFAVKATYGEVNHVGREIFKDPITDDGTKKSLKGLLKVDYDENGVITVYDQVSADEEKMGLLTTVFLDGKLTRFTTLNDIRIKLQSQIN